jgi:hypothetical protein
MDVFQGSLSGDACSLSTAQAGVDVNFGGSCSSALKKKRMKRNATQNDRRPITSNAMLLGPSTMTVVNL